MTHLLINNILLHIPAQLRGAAQNMMNGEVVRHLIRGAAKISVAEDTDSEVLTARSVDLRREGIAVAPTLIGHSESAKARGQRRKVVSIENEVDPDESDTIRPS